MNIGENPVKMCCKCKTEERAPGQSYCRECRKSRKKKSSTSITDMMTKLNELEQQITDLGTEINMIPFEVKRVLKG